MRRRSTVTGARSFGDLAHDAFAGVVEVGDHLADHVLEREHEHGVLGVVVLEVRLAEHVRDQAEQPARLALDRREGLDGDRVVGQRRLAEDVDVPLDAGERRPQLVRRGGDEVALHPVELAELRDRVLFPLQQVRELVGLLLELIVLPPQRPGDADHQRQHHHVQREQADARARSIASASADRSPPGSRSSPDRPRCTPTTGPLIPMRNGTYVSNSRLPSVRSPTFSSAVRSETSLCSSPVEALPSGRPRRSAAGRPPADRWRTAIGSVGSPELDPEDAGIGRERRSSHRCSISS